MSIFLCKKLEFSNLINLIKQTDCFIAIKALNTDLIFLSRSHIGLLEVWKIQRNWFEVRLNRHHVVFRVHILFPPSLRSKKGAISKNHTPPPLPATDAWLSELIMHFIYFWKILWTAVKKVLEDAWILSSNGISGHAVW